MKKFLLGIVGVTLTMTTLAHASSFDEIYAQMVSYLENVSRINTQLNSEFIMNKDSLQMKLRGEVSGALSLNMQGITNTKNGEAQQEISLKMEDLGDSYENISLKTNLSTILKQNELFLKVKDLTGSVNGYGEELSIEEAMDIPTSGILDQWISIGNDDYLPFALDMGFNTSQLSSFQGEFANATMIQSLKEYPIFKLKDKNADGSYNVLVSVANLQNLLEGGSPLLLQALHSLSDSYADSFGEIRLVPKENSVILILKDEDYEEERTITFSANSIMGVFKDHYYESDFYFIYAKGNEKIKF